MIEPSCVKSCIGKPLGLKPPAPVHKITLLALNVYISSSSKENPAAPAILPSSLIRCVIITRSNKGIFLSSIGFVKDLLYKGDSKKPQSLSSVTLAFEF